MRMPMNQSVDEGTQCGVAFMANLSSLVHQPSILDNEGYTPRIIKSLKCGLSVSQEIAREETIRLYAETEIDDNTSPVTADLHKDLLGTRNPGLGYMAKRAQPALYDVDTFLHPNSPPHCIGDSEEVLVHQVVSMKKMNEKPGHVRPENGFYEKLNALKFVPQQELSREQAYWLPANEIASNASNPATPVTPFVHNRPPPSSWDQKALETEESVCNATMYSLESERGPDGRKRLFLCYCDTEKLSALTSENTKLKALVHGKTSSGPSTSDTPPKGLASGMFTIVQRPTQETTRLQNKKANVSVNCSTRTTATESRKPMPKSHTQNHRILPSKSVNARRAADHNRKLNVVDHNQFVIRSLKSVNTKTPQTKHSVNHSKKVWNATKNHNVNTTKTTWRPTGKVVGSVKLQWKPIGRHFALYDNCPLTRIMKPIVEPLELTSLKPPTPHTRSKGRTVADSIAERLTRPTAYKFKDPIAVSFLSGYSTGASTVLEECLSRCGENLSVKKVPLIESIDHREEKLKQVKDQDQVITSSSEDHDQGVKD
ncbi:hypothetical protein Tco_0059437 [Tanacetum coccineum]